MVHQAEALGALHHILEIDMVAVHLTLTVSQFTFEGYKAVFAEPNIVRGYGNSILYTVLGTIYSVALIYLVAYPLSVPDLPGKKLISIFFIIDFSLLVSCGLVSING